MPSNRKTISLLFESQKLKKIPRAGWVIAGAPMESLAAHSFGVAVISIILARMEGFSEKEEHTLLTSSLLHDLHEARTGDHHRIARHYVKSDERRAEREMLFGTPLSYKELLPNKKLAMLAHDADRLDLLLRSIENSNAGNRNMPEFIRFSLSQIKSRSGRRLAKLALLKLKK